MKELKKHIFIIGMMMIAGLNLYAKGEKETSSVYMFGVAGAFGDSIICMTDIQQVEGAQIGKNGFLVARNQYAYQLKGYLENVEGMPNRTCTIFFSPKKSKIEKKYLKIRNRYQKEKSTILKYVTPNQFKFTKFPAE